VSCGRIGGVEVWLLSFLTLAHDGGKKSDSCSSLCTSGREPRYLLNRRLGGPQRKASCCTALSAVVNLYTYLLLLFVVITIPVPYLLPFRRVRKIAKSDD
jgi:hypothetical protein